MTSILSSEESQYFPSAICSPSLDTISLQDSAGSSLMDPRGTASEKFHIGSFHRHAIRYRKKAPTSCLRKSRIK